ncbi:hypothetical protein KC366_g13294 [Hortaea werneckii]|uniref:INO80 complex subunit F domain-containing protein n=1 Tax=Hortaea werneckii TaxID=91943 RepID=A0A3M7HH52_HORWE|nr:hypothetical protein KC358_g12809 [Hortaea werneckii]KAI7021658.1 hypothetical protein KC366_g13294 [Hortaea werneckii]KAI7022454.1 hypothetical protein KC362_g13018 [Hortaea werneckii]KAI7121426.1 hypothetical protein KC337_g13244 [Hortaea werneckii]KAI7170240.1 hypothetical protein KC352_g25098 [Hortaea werneckii]
MPPPSETASQNTPLAPSVEKAYYRKCIQLKRRLNEVEGANEELKIRRVRLDRSIMKMRLERAFLLDELRKRMDQNIDGSEASEDERTASPPPDRPHRDKRRRHANPEPPPAQPQHPSHPPHRTPSDHASSRGQVAHTSNHSAPPPPHETSEDHSNPAHSGPSQQHKESTPQYPPLGHGSPYAGVPMGRPGSSTAQTVQTNGTGEEYEGREGDGAVGGGGRGGGGGSFTAVNS